MSLAKLRHRPGRISNHQQTCDDKLDTASSGSPKNDRLRVIRKSVRLQEKPLTDSIAGHAKGQEKAISARQIRPQQ